MPHPCPTYQLWPFSFRQENRPQISKINFPEFRRLDLSLSGTKKIGVIAKGVSAESSVTAKKQKMPKDTGPSSTFGTQKATAKRGKDCGEILQKTQISRPVPISDFGVPISAVLAGNEADICLKIGVELSKESQ